MLHAGLDLSRTKLDVCLLSDQGEHLDQLAVPPDVDSLRTLARRVGEVHRQPVCAVIESMTGARMVHDTLEAQGWSVEIADAHEVKGLAPLACKTDKIDSKVLAVLSHRDLVPAIWLPDPRVRDERELARFRLLGRMAAGCLLAGVGLLTLAEAGWAHGVGVTALLPFVLLGFLAATPHELAAMQPDDGAHARTEPHSGRDRRGC